MFSTPNILSFSVISQSIVSSKIAHLVFLNYGTTPKVIVGDAIRSCYNEAFTVQNGIIVCIVICTVSIICIICVIHISIIVIHNNFSFRLYLEVYCQSVFNL